MLQLNLCNSGYAGCFTGRAVAVAAEAVTARRPDVLTLNEICEGDLATLRTALAGPAGASVAVAFQAAENRTTDGDYHCRNGQRYGIAVLTRLVGGSRADAAVVTHGTFRAQDPADPEERVWVCLQAEGVAVACTSHLVNTVPSVIAQQCRELLAEAVPSVAAGRPDLPLVVGADLNLRNGGTPDARSCTAEYTGVDDGAVQHVLTRASGQLHRTELVDLGGATDHPGLLASVAAA